MAFILYRIPNSFSDTTTPPSVFEGQKYQGSGSEWSSPSPLPSPQPSSSQHSSPIPPSPSTPSPSSPSSPGSVKEWSSQFISSPSDDNSSASLSSNKSGVPEGWNLEHTIKGAEDLAKWSMLPKLLEKDGRRIKEINASGFGLLESVCEALSCDFDIHIDPKDMLKGVSKELVDHLEYTRYLKSPLCKAGVDYDSSKMSNRSYGKAVCDLYLPAISSAYDIEIRVIKKVGDYYAIMNITSPQFAASNVEEKKRITLLYRDFNYKPIVWSLCWDHILQPSSFEVELEEEQQIRSLPPKSTRGALPIDTMEEDCIVISDEENTLPDLPGETEQANIQARTPPPTQQQRPEQSSPNQDKTEKSTANELQDDDIPSIHFKTTSPKTPFDMGPFAGVIPEVVQEQPHDIDGTRYYVIDVPEEEPMFFKYRDTRFFKMNSSKRKGFNGIRRVGTCRGNFKCRNEEYGHFVNTQSPNTMHFKVIGREHFCSICDSRVERDYCGAKKLIEFHHQSRLLEIYHHGKHTCHAKPPPDTNDKYILEQIKKYGTKTTPKQLAQLEMTAELNKQIESGCTDMDAIINIASRLTDRNRIRQIKQKLNNEVKSEKHSLSAVAELKAITDTSDKYLIYKVNDSNMSGVGDSYVFKSSRRLGQLAINMDIEGNENVLQGEPAYFDGMHKRCEGWKTLTLWVYHPNPQRLYRLATMEVKGETSKSVALFWSIFNDMLSEIKKQPGYKFNPKFWVTDEAGANFNGIKQVYGPGAQRTSTCQFHFSQCLRRLLNKFPSELMDLKDEFQVLMMQLLSVTTLQEYNNIKSRLEDITLLVPAAKGGLQWWLARRYNLFPVFRGYCMASVNLAEIGHSTLKKKKPLTLVDAAWEDVCTTILQEQEHSSFLSGGARQGKGPTNTLLAMKSKKAQLKRSATYQKAFQNKDFHLSDEGGNFIPMKRAKHRPNEDIHPDVQGGSVQVDMPRPTTSGFIPASQLSQQETTPVAPPRPPTDITRLYNITNNPPLICIWSPLTKKCYGCKGDLFKARPQPPNDLILKMQVSIMHRISF